MATKATAADPVRVVPRGDDETDKTPELGERWLKVDDVVDRLQMGKSTIYLYMRQGILPHVRVRGLVRIPERDLARWMEEQKIGGNE